MYCKYCGTQLAEDARFCGNCGKNIEETVTESAPAQPVYTEEVAAEKPSVFSSETLLPMIAAMVFGFFKFINFARGIFGGTTALGVFGNMIGMGAAALIILAFFKVLKNESFFCAIAMFALAFVELLSMGGIFWYISLLTMPAFAIAGVHYLLKGKVFNNTIKMIMAIAVWAMGFFAFIAYICWHLPFFTIFCALSIAAAEGFFIFSYTPYK